MSDGTAAPDPEAVGAGPAAPEPEAPLHGRLDRIQGAQQRVHSTWDSLPWFLRWSVVWSACLLIIAGGVFLLATLASRLAPLTIALAATLFLAAMLDPLAVRLRRLRLPPALAALISLFLLLAVIGGAAYLVWTLTADQFSSLSKQLDEGLDRTRDFITGSLPVSPEQLDRWTKQATDGLRRSTPDPVAGARTAAEVAGAVLLIFVLLFFLLKDGRPMWQWVLSRVSDRSRPAFIQAGRNGWHTLSAYTRGTVAIAAIDGIGIGLALVLLGVPLAFPLAVVTFLGGFIPIIGATVAGSVAVLVALAANGPTTALLTLLAVIAVQQTEGNLLEPLIMKRQVRLHPVVILVAVTAGTLFGGIAGAFVAVPVTAVVYRVVDTITALRQGRDPS
ncbi:AI-2E family transporter [Micromonospora sp. NBC_01796]|uniref:AI-2E family transporter n=1 Tax=Micromonospora sp. NBC_01796 TaxID=2975987 RepID=UPI002DD9D3F5|nr:AI-2E family transporter [Micromonospora sp. NBC_01796]WSA87967.1 AI-2E family transporter [Micromonospora sp. NBC_01796]